MPISRYFYRITAVVLTICFAGTSVSIPPVQAGEVVVPIMPAPGTMVGLSPAYTPAYLKGIVIHPDNALKFDFIVSRGDGNLTEDQKKIEYNKLIKYFLASLAVPDKDQWVNLSPFEKNRIIEDNFGKTEMGRDLLAQDYLLKQITSSLIYPQEGLGKKFWDEVYAKAHSEYGNTNIPVSTFNKVWIVPDKATIYEKGNTAYVLENHLKVMLEEDYLAMSKNDKTSPIKDSSAGAEASQVVREIILPELESEVNEGKNFALLRQVYSGMLLAAWYKRALKESLLARVYADKAKVKGIDQDPKNNEAIYEQYLKAYKKGVFNFIKEEPDAASRQVIPRKYFSGGTTAYDYAQAVTVKKHISGTDGTALANALGSADLASVAIEQPSNTLNQVSNEWSQDQKRLAGFIAKARQANRIPNILTMCTGNLNRSALMEMTLKELAAKEGITVDVHSGGTREWSNGLGRIVAQRLEKTFTAQGPLRGTPLERLLKAVALSRLDLLKTRWSFSRKELRSEDFLSAFRNFDRDVVVEEAYRPSLNLMSEVFQKLNQDLSETKFLPVRTEIMSVARKNGVRKEIRNAFRPQIVTPADIRWADVIIVADETHVQFIKDYFPGVLDRTVLLKQLPHNTKLTDPNLPDPMTGEITESESFAQINQLMNDAVMPLLRVRTDPAMITHPTSVRPDDKVVIRVVHRSSSNQLVFHGKRDNWTRPLNNKNLQYLSDFQRKHMVRNENGTVDIPFNKLATYTYEIQLRASEVGQINFVVLDNDRNIEGDGVNSIIPVRPAFQWGSNTPITEMGFVKVTEDRLLSLGFTNLSDLTKGGVFRELLFKSNVSVRMFGEIIKTLRRHGFQLGGDPFGLDVNIDNVTLGMLNQYKKRVDYSPSELSWRGFSKDTTVEQWRKNPRGTTADENTIRWFIETYGKETQEGEDAIDLFALDASFTEAVKTPRRPIVAYNMKGELLTADVDAFLDGIAADYQSRPETRADVAAFFAEGDLKQARAKIDQLEKDQVIPKGFIKLGAQNVRVQDRGPYTAHAPSIEQLKNWGVETVLLGHSEITTTERGEPTFVESDELIAKKVELVVKAGLQPIVAFGETEEAYKSTLTESVLRSQMRERLKFVTGQQMIESNMVVAYEPVWSIGEGKQPAPINVAEDMNEFLRRIIFYNKGPQVAAKIRIIYGGNVSAANAEALSGQINVDGGLVGGASRKAETAIPIYRSFAENKDSDAAMDTEAVDFQEIRPVDNAQLTPGGIDLNGANLNMQIKGTGVPLPLAQQDMAQLGRVEGFVPRILEIKPATTLPILSEL